MLRTTLPMILVLSGCQKAEANPLSKLLTAPLSFVCEIRNLSFFGRYEKRQMVYTSKLRGMRSVGIQMSSAADISARIEVSRY